MDRIIDIREYLMLCMYDQAHLHSNEEYLEGHLYKVKCNIKCDPILVICESEKPLKIKIF